VSDNDPSTSHRLPVRESRRQARWCSCLGNGDATTPARPRLSLAINAVPDRVLLGPRIAPNRFTIVGGREIRHATGLRLAYRRDIPIGWAYVVRREARTVHTRVRPSVRPFVHLSRNHALCFGEFFIAALRSLVHACAPVFCLCCAVRVRTQRVRTSVYEEPIVRQTSEPNQLPQSSDHSCLSLLLSDMRIPTRAAPRPPGQRDPIWSSR